MATLDIAPAFLLMNGLKQFLKGDKSLFVRHQPEFIRPLAQYIAYKLGKCHNSMPSPFIHG